MSAMSNFLEGELLKHIFRTGSYTKPTALGVALCSGIPFDAATGALTGLEIPNAGAYTRQDVPPLDANWIAVGVNGQTSNVAAVTFPVATSDWGWVSGVAICDHAGYGSGNLLLYGTLTTPKLIGSGDQFRFAVNDLVVTFA